MDQVEPASPAPSATESQTAGQRREEAAQAQEQLREQTEADRQQRINELMERAKAYSKQQQYEPALDQLQAVLAIDPLNNEALTLQQMDQEMVVLRKLRRQREMEMDQLSAKPRAEMLQGADEASVPYADEITYPKDWREVMQRPTRAPAEPFPPTANQPQVPEGSTPYSSEATRPKSELTVTQARPSSAPATTAPSSDRASGGQVPPAQGAGPMVFQSLSGGPGGGQVPPGAAQGMGGMGGMGMGGYAGGQVPPDYCARRAWHEGWLWRRVLSQGRVESPRHNPQCRQ